MALNVPTLILLSAAILLLAATFLPLLRITPWWIRGLDFPRLQLAVLSALFLVALSVWPPAHSTTYALLVLAGMVCLLFQGWWILPYTPVFPREVQAFNPAAAQQRISTITANVLTPNRNSAALLSLVRQHQPDILVTLESDAWWEQQLAALEGDYPHSIKCPLDNLYGMHVYSRLPLADSSVQYLVEPDVPSIHTVVELAGGQNVRLHFLHPAPPSPTENARSSERDAELIVVGKSVADSDLPVVVTGDLNDVAWSATTRLFRKVSGLLDPRVGRGMYNTFHADYTLIRWPLDHIFHSHHFTLVTIQRLPAFGSDHFAIYTELAFQPGVNSTDDGLTVDARHKQWANEKTRAEDVNASDVPTPGA